MASSNAITSSAALAELKTDLTNLSATLHEISELMNTDMSQVGEAWQDNKYQEFVDNYAPQIQKCEDIADRYNEWCKKVLDPTIDNVIAVERTDVGGVSSPVKDVKAVGMMAGVGVGTVAAVTAASVGKRVFNMGSTKTASPHLQSNSTEAPELSKEEHSSGIYRNPSIPYAKGRVTSFPSPTPTSPYNNRIVTPTTPTETVNSDVVEDESKLIQQAFEKNNKDLGKALGIEQGPKMSIEEADKQNANPNYPFKYIADPEGDFVDAHGNRFRKNPDWVAGRDEQYTVNCATCAAAYALRLRGFDVKAKGNPERDGNLNTWLSKSHSFDIWNNPDGTKASPSHYVDWMKDNNLVTMSPNDYKNFFEEKCKDQGVYIVTVAWKSEGGHATILQRDTDGKLYYIEPQKFDAYKSNDGRRSIDDLVNRMAQRQPSTKGVMRVDDKLFNVDYARLFEI